MKPQEGDIVFFKDNSLMARMIRLVETGKFGQDAPNHVAVITLIYNDTYIITEAQVGGVCQINISKYAKSKKWYAKMRPPRDIDAGLAWLNEQVAENREYDYKQLIGIWARGFCRLLGPKIYERSRRIKNFLDSKQSFICSEIVEQYAAKTGARLWPQANIGEVTPWDLFRSREIEFLL